MSTGQTPKQFKCNETDCKYSASTLGALNVHLSRVHNQLVGRALKKDEGIPCGVDGCTLVFSYLATLKAHRRKVHNIQDEPLLICDFSGCSYSNRKAVSFRRHRATTHGLGDTLIACTFHGCHFKAAFASMLPLHMLKHESADERQARISKAKETPILDKKKCDWAGCTYKSKNNYDVVGHKAAVHKVGRELVMKCFRCDEQGCDFVATQVDTVRRHRWQVHGDKSVEISCDVPGCSYKTSNNGRVNIHKKQKHSIGVVWKACPVDACDYKAKITQELKRHLRRMHGNGKENNGEGEHPEKHDTEATHREQPIQSVHREEAETAGRTSTESSARSRDEKTRVDGGGRTQDPRSEEVYRPQPASSNK